MNTAPYVDEIVIDGRKQMYQVYKAIQQTRIFRIEYKREFDGDVEASVLTALDGVGPVFG